MNLLFTIKHYKFRNSGLTYSCVWFRSAPRMLQAGKESLPVNVESNDSRADGRAMAEMVADFMTLAVPWIYSAVRYGMMFISVWRKCRFTVP
jgi:hypothetical protein